MPVIMAVSDDQQRFLEQLAGRIPRLFDAIRAGNIKSEYIVGVRRIGQRQVRLKLVAEVVDSGANPLRTHSTTVPVRVCVHAEFVADLDADPETKPAISSTRIASNSGGDSSDEAD